MFSEAVQVALVQILVPGITAIGALIISLRAQRAIDIEKARKEGAETARAHRQRKTDPLDEIGKKIDAVTDQSTDKKEHGNEQK